MLTEAAPQPSPPPPEAPGRNARSVLRSATNAAHERLHHNAAFAALLRGDLSHAGYTTLLLRLHGLHAPIENALAPFSNDPALAWHGGGMTWRRTRLLERDLEALGLNADTIRSAPDAASLLPPLPDCNAALGCAWVVEGSSLGARAMSGNVGRLLGSAKVLGGGAFFASTADGNVQWRACCNAVETCGADPVALQAMVQAAVATFDVFEAWLDAPA